MTALTEFLEMYPGKRNTIVTYRSAIIDYLSFIYGVKRAGRRSTDQELQTYEKLSDQYIDEVKIGKRDHVRDLERYAVTMNGTPAKTKILRTAAVKELLRFNRIKIEEADKKAINKRLGRKNRAETRFQPLSKEIIQSILNQTDVRGRALILFMASSGVRIGEALSITPADVDLESTPARVHIREEISKTGDERYTFISEEAKTALREFKRMRDSYLARAMTRGAFPKDNKEIIHTFLFGMTRSTAYAIWESATKKAGYYQKDEKTGFLTVNPHGLRKFFRTEMARAIKEDVVEAMIGHAEGLESVYRMHNPETLAEEYLKAVSTVTILETDAVTKSRVNNLEEENRRLKQQLEEMNSGIEKIIEEKILTIVQAIRADNPLPVTT